MKKLLSLLSLLALVFIIIICSVSNFSHKRVVKVGVVDSYLSAKTLDRYSIKNTFNLKISEKSNHGDMVVDILKKQAANIDLYYACAINHDDSGEIADVIAGLKYLKNEEVDVVCLSFTTMNDDAKLHNTIKELTNEGIIVVAACLNYSDTATYPASYPEVLSVSNCDYNDANIRITDVKTKNILRTYKWNDCSTSALTAFITGQIAKKLSYEALNINSFVEKYNSLN